MARLPISELQERINNAISEIDPKAWSEIYIHQKNKAVILEDLLERKFEPYRFGHDEIENAAKVLKKQEIPAFTIVFSLLWLGFGIFFISRSLGTSNLNFSIIFTLFGFVPWIFPVYRNMQFIKAAKRVKDGHYRAYKLFIDDKREFYSDIRAGDNSLERRHYYMVEGRDFLFRIDKMEYKSVVAGQNAVIIVIEGIKGSVFCLYGENCLRTGIFPK